MNSRHFNLMQKRLVEQCERLHEAGVRHKATSSTACEYLLMDALRSSVPTLSFHGGHIKFAADSVVGMDLEPEGLSSQVDVIACSGQSLFSHDRLAIIGVNAVRAVIEVKKWLYPGHKEQVHRAVKKLRSGFIDRGYRPVPILLVTFRFRDKGEGIDSWKGWLSEVGLASDDGYCFYGKFAVRHGRHLYPWQEEGWDRFEHSSFAGEFERLVNRLGALQFCDDRPRPWHQPTRV